MQTGELVERVNAAARRVAAHVRETELRPSQIPGCEGTSLKLENTQLTGSFKLRGAVNRVLTLAAAERQRGCVTASSGNHGAAVAHALSALDIDGLIFVPETSSPQKVARIRDAGAEVRFHGTDGLDTELFARDYAERNGMCYLSPYNDADVIAGQGTIACELLRQSAPVDRVYIAVGGGGLIAGVGARLKAQWPSVEIVGCQPAASDVMAASLAAGRILDRPSRPTLSDGTAGGIEPDAITFPLCRALVDRFVVVGEDAIADAMRRLAVHDGQRVEGAAGVAMAARLQDGPGGSSIVIVCGGNVTDEVFDRAVGQSTGDA